MRTLLCCALLMMLQTGVTKIVPQPGCRIWDPYCQPAIGHEPMDVPAVQEDYVAHKKSEGFACGQDWCVATKDILEKRWTCADKSRVLLTSEDGARHCIKFPQGATQ